MMGKWKMKRWKGFRNQEKDDEEEIDNFILIVRLYNRDSCITTAN